MSILMPETIRVLSEGMELWMIWNVPLSSEERLHEKDSMLELESRLWSAERSSDGPGQGRVNSTFVMFFPCVKVHAYIVGPR